MGTPTYTPLATITLTSSASSVTFSSIPATYRDLVLVIDVLGTSTFGRASRLRLNSDTGSNYPQVVMTGDGSTASSYSFTDTNVQISQMVSTSRNLGICQIMDYTQTNKHKSILGRWDGTFGVFAYSGRWANTSAVTSVSITASNEPYASGSTFSLYGIAA
jgi:hypothetical protein